MFFLEGLFVREVGRRSGGLRGWKLLLLPVLVAALGLSISLPGQMGDGLSAVSSTTGSDGAATPTVSGVVLNAATGLPVARALVRLNGRAMLTDHQGKFEFDQFSGGGGRVEVIKPGYYFALDPSDGSGFDVPTSQLGKPMQLRLYPEALLTGTIGAPNGDALPNVLIRAFRRSFNEDEESWIPVAQTLTNARGSFRLPVPAGDYRMETLSSVLQGTLEVISPEVVPNTSSSDTSDVIRIGSGEEQHFDVQPSVGSAHIVEVTPDTDSGSEFLRIMARAANGVSFPVRTESGRANGSYRLELPNGTYTLTASTRSRDGSEEAQTNVTVADHDVSGVVFHFAPVPLLPVEMTVGSDTTSDNAGSPPTLMRLGLRLERIQAGAVEGMSSVQLLPQHDGSFAFTAPPGRYRLEAGHAGGWYVASASYGDTDLLQQELSVGAGSGGMPILVTVSNQTGSLQGSVSLKGQPMACWIYLVDGSPSAQPVIQLRSNADGSFVMSNLAPGSYQAIAFENRNPQDFRHADALTPYTTMVQSVRINSGAKATLDLDAVPAAEIVP
jgi:hypothetical protein